MTVFQFLLPRRDAAGLAVVCCLVAMLAGCATLSSGAVMDGAFVRSRPLVVAHRGASAVAPENTLVAYRLAIASGAAMAECDVHLSRDRVPVLMHDDTLERTTNGKGLVSELTAAELQKLDAGSWKGPTFKSERVPTLEEALALVRGKIRLIIEIKASGMASDVIDALKKQKVRPSDVTIFSFDARAIWGIARVEPRLPTVLLWRDVPADRPGRQDLLDIALTARAQGIGVSFRSIDVRFVRMAHARGLHVFVFTVNVEDDMRRLIQWGVDAVITARPKVALELLE